MSKLNEYVGYLCIQEFYKDRCYASREEAMKIHAHTKEEALGLALEAHPQTNAGDWEIIGGESEETKPWVEGYFIQEGWEA